MRYCNTQALSIVFEWLKLPLCIQEMLGSVTSPDTSSPDRCFVRILCSLVDSYQYTWCHILEGHSDTP
jgi:hypothetical protein